jgi:Mg/Co/Ni transporter MgtE
MSKRQEKIAEAKQSQADFLREKAENRWTQSQLKAAMAKTELDLAVETFKDLNKEMTTDQITATEEQVQIQYKRIEEYLMSEKERYLESIGIQED